MPLYSFRCTECSAEFETLVSGSDTPLCQACGSPKLERLLSSPSSHKGKTKATFSRAKAQAAREGHLSNFSKSEIKGK